MRKYLLIQVIGIIPINIINQSKMLDTNFSIIFLDH